MATGLGGKALIQTNFRPGEGWALLGYYCRRHATRVVLLRPNQIVEPMRVFESFWELRSLWIDSHLIMGIKFFFYMGSDHLWKLFFSFFVDECLSFKRKLMCNRKRISHSYNIQTNWTVSHCHCVCIYPTPLPGSVFIRGLTSMNSKISFSQIGCHTKVKELSMLFYP